MISKNSNIKIAKALRIAFWKVQVPSTAAILIPVMFYFVMSKLLHPITPLMQFVLIALICAGLIISWLIWSFQIPRWRLEAYKLVDDIEELKSEAIAANLIWPDGSFFEKTEIASEALKAEIKKVMELKRR